MAISLKSFNSPISNGALSEKNLPTTIKVLNWGLNETTNGDVELNQKTLDCFEAYLKKTGREVDCPIDFDHCSVAGSKEYVAGQPKAIAGYGTPRLVEGDGLYLDDIEWTDMGKKFGKNYKDLSPAAVVDSDGTVLGLDSVALTPTGAVRGLTFYSATTFQEFEKQINNMKTIKNFNTQTEEGVKAEISKWPGNEGVKALAKVFSISDEEALQKMKELQEHEKSEIVNEDATSEHGTKTGVIETKEAGNVQAEGKTISESSVEDDEEEKTKAMSANDAWFPDAYKFQTPQYNQYNKYNIMNDTEIKQMAAEMATETGLDNSVTERILRAYLAKFEGQKPEIKGQITHKANTEDGGLKSFSVQLNALKTEIESIKNEKSQEVARANEYEKQILVQQASKEGKVLPLSANDIKNIDVTILRSIVEKQPKDVVPMTSKLKAFSAGDEKSAKAKSVAVFESMVKKA